MAIREPTRILLGEMPRMLSDIVGATLSAQPDMEVLVGDPHVARLRELATRSRPDVVIIGADDPNVARDLVMEVPRLKVLAVTGSDGEGYLYELRPRRVRLGEVTPHMLVTEVRRCAEEAPRWSD